MPTLQRAKHIQKMVGGEIYWDTLEKCFRAIQSNSLSFYIYGRDRFERVADYVLR